MRYWDTSALLPLLVEEPKSSGCAELLRSDPQIVTWWVTRVECVSALSRLSRDGSLTDDGLKRALADLGTLAGSFAEVLATERLRVIATRLLRVHPLRAADSLQLASAIVAADDSRETLDFVSYDNRLQSAAEKEGFRCLP